MKKILFIILAAVLSVCFLGCTDASSKDPILSSSDLTDKELNKVLNTKFPSDPFCNVEESVDSLSDDEIKDIIDDASSKKYDIYPDLHNIPLTATLFKNGEEIALDVRDPRLIGLMNLYNNSLYYKKCSYTQGLYNIDRLNSILNDEFRLVLTFTPNESAPIGQYIANTLHYDMIIVTNDRGFTVIAHDIPEYEVEEEKYPYYAAGHSPLYYLYPWLDLFEF